MPEQYTYQVGKINFIVTPVYKDKRSGETMKDILLKLMLADLESGDILNIGGKRRYNILGKAMRVSRCHSRPMGTSKTRTILGFG